MPNNTSEDDIIIQGDENEPALNPDAHSGEDTPPAKINDSEDDSAPIKATDDYEELQAKLKNKARNERQLGSVASKATRLLVNQAVNGNQDAIDTIADDPELVQYVQRKFPEEYSTIYENTTTYESNEFDKDSLKSEIISDIKKSSQIEELERKLQSTGVKGRDNYDKMKGFAESLLEKGASIDEAVAMVSKDLPKAQPRIARGNGSGNSDQIVLSKSKILAAGLNPEHVKKYAKELPAHILRKFTN